MNYNKDITINEISEWDATKKEVGVSWGSYGTVSTEEAKKFIKVLEEKIKEAEEKNK